MASRTDLGIEVQWKRAGFGTNRDYGMRSDIEDTGIYGIRSDVEDTGLRNSKRRLSDDYGVEAKVHGARVPVGTSSESAPAPSRVAGTKMGASSTVGGTAR